MEKKCTKCGEVKGLDEFSNSKNEKHGKSVWCKSCFKEYNIQNKDKRKEYDKKYREKNRENIKERYRENTDWHKDYRKKNEQKIKEYKKKWTKENRIKDNLNSKKWKKNNKEKINKYFLNRRKTDILFNLRNNIKSNILSSLKRNKYTKKTKTYNILKCEYNFFMHWLNGLASNGYTYGIGDLQIDHVVPSSLAKTEDETLLLNHYSNFQLLSTFENQSKGNRYVDPLNLARVLEHHPNPDKIREIHARL